MKKNIENTKKQKFGVKNNEIVKNIAKNSENMIEISVFIRCFLFFEYLFIKRLSNIFSPSSEQIGNKLNPANTRLAKAKSAVKK